MPFPLVRKVTFGLEGKRYADIEDIQRSMTAMLNIVSTEEITILLICFLVMKSGALSSKRTILNKINQLCRKAFCFFDMSHTCVERNSKQLGYINKLDIWVPRKLNEIQLTKRIFIWDSLLKRNETDRFLKRIITGDEKWVVDDNVVQRISWSKRDEPAQSTSEADIIKRRLL